MRKFIITFIILSQGIAVFASTAVITIDEGSVRFSSEEVIALWESKSEKEIFSDRVLSDFRNMTAAGFFVNVLCSRDTISKLSELRGLSAGIIFSGMSGGVTGAESLAGLVLSRIGNISLTPLTLREKQLIHFSEIMRSTCTAFPPSGLSEKQNIPEVSSFPALNLITSQNNMKLKVSHVKKTINIHCDVPQCRKDLFDREFADLYRLFIYIKDSSGNGSAECFTYHSINLASAEPSSNSLKQENNFNRLNQKPKTGVYL